jgi:hypothetical protein
VWNAGTGKCEISATVCGPNTTWDTTSQTCTVLPSNFCGTNTLWDETSGTCLVDPSSCGPNTTWNTTSQTCTVFPRNFCARDTYWNPIEQTCRANCIGGQIKDPTTLRCRELLVDDCISPQTYIAPTTIGNRYGTCVATPAKCG